MLDARGIFHARMKHLGEQDYLLICRGLYFMKQTPFYRMSVKNYRNYNKIKKKSVKIYNNENNEMI